MNLDLPIAQRSEAPLNPWLVNYWNQGRVNSAISGDEDRRIAEQGGGLAVGEARIILPSRITNKDSTFVIHI